MSQFLINIFLAFHFHIIIHESTLPQSHFMHFSLVQQNEIWCPFLLATIITRNNTLYGGIIHLGRSGWTSSPRRMKILLTFFSMRSWNLSKEWPWWRTNFSQMLKPLWISKISSCREREYDKEIATMGQFLGTKVSRGSGWSCLWILE